MKYKRTLLILLALLLLLSLMVYSLQNHYSNDPHIHTLHQLFENPQAVNNTVVSFYAEVLAVNTTTRTLRVFIQERPYTYPQVIIDAGDLDIHHLTKGDLIDIIGIFHADKHITATYLHRTEQWKDDLIYLRSLPAIPFALFLFFRTWTFNTTTWRFERRKKHA